MSDLPVDPGLAPLLMLVDLLGRRHALALLWELRGGPQPFRALARTVGAPEPAATQRLRELRDSGLVEVDEAGDYRLTAHGRRLQGTLDPLAAFAGSWHRLTPRQRIPRGSSDRGRGQQ